MVGSSLIAGSDAVAARSRLVRPIVSTIMRVPTPICPAWGCNGPQPINIRITGTPYPPSPSPSNGSSGSSLAIAQALYNSNPSLLTAAQWSMLQAAGIVAGTVPYSSAGLTPGASGAIDPATGQSYASELAAAQAGAATAATTTTGTDALSTQYAGLPLYLWLAIGAGGLFLFTRGRR